MPFVVCPPPPLCRVPPDPARGKEVGRVLPVEAHGKEVVCRVLSVVAHGKGAAHNKVVSCFFPSPFFFHMVYPLYFVCRGLNIPSQSELTTWLMIV